MQLDDFLSKVDHGRIVEAIRSAEARSREGLVQAVAQAGELLAQHFPRTAGADVNELPDQISEDR